VTFEGHVVKVGAPIIEISSSLIRSAIKAGKNVQSVLPKAVWVYLDEMNFYK
jgi:nicotinate-nucleotide adenylyltransferase